VLNQEQVEGGIEVDGSSLSGVSGHCVWEDTSCKTGADSSHQLAAPGSDEDDGHSLRTSRHGNHCQLCMSYNGCKP